MTTEEHALARALYYKLYDPWAHDNATLQDVLTALERSLNDTNLIVVPKGTLK